MPSIYTQEHNTAPRNLLEDRPQLPYLVPYLAFLLVMLPGAAFGQLGNMDWHELWLTYHPGLYALKTVVAAILLLAFWKHYTPISWTFLPLGLIVGLIGTFQWVLTEYASQKLGVTVPPKAADVYNPLQRLPNEQLRILFYIIRIAGPTLVVPVMEELFFRDFLQRFFIAGSRFKEEAIGAFSWFSVLAMSALFASSHVQWPSGFIYGLLMGLLLVRTKSLGACIVAHGTTNLTLYLWVVCISHDWQFM